MWFFKATFGFGKTSVEVKIQESTEHLLGLRCPTSSQRQLEQDRSHTRIYVHRLGPPGSCRDGGPWEGGDQEKASPHCGVSRFVTEVWGLNTRTLSHRASGSRRSLLLRLEMGTDGGEMSHGGLPARTSQDAQRAQGGASDSFPLFSHFFRVKIVDKCSNICLHLFFKSVAWWGRSYIATSKFSL